MTRSIKYKGIILSVSKADSLVTFFMCSLWLTVHECKEFLPKIFVRESSTHVKFCQGRLCVPCYRKESSI